MEHYLQRKFTLIPADLNFLRGEYESETEWKLRKKFLELNYGLSLKRLNCLSRCFVNIALYGCSYPCSVMTEVHRRGASLLDEGSERMKEARQNYASSLMKIPGALSMNILDDGWIHDPEVDLQVTFSCGAQNSKRRRVYTKTSKTQSDTAQTSKTQPDTAKTSKTQSDTAQTSKTQSDTAQTSKTQSDTAKTSKTQSDTAKTSKTQSDTAQTSKKQSDTAQTSKTQSDTAQTSKTQSDTAKTSKTQSDTAKTSKTQSDTAQTSKTQSYTAKTSKTQCDTAQTSKTQFDTAQTSKTQFDTAQTSKTRFDTAQTSKTQFDTAQTLKTRSSETTPANCRYSTRQSKRLRDNQQEAQTSEILSNNFHDAVQISDTVLVDINRDSQNSTASAVCIRAKAPDAKILGKWEIWNLSHREQNPILKTMRMVAFEVFNLSQNPKGADKKLKYAGAVKRLKHAGKCIQVDVEFKFEEIPIRKGRTDFMCHIFIDGVKVAQHKGRGAKRASVQACKAAIKIISMPEIEVCLEALEEGSVAGTEQKCSELFGKSSSNCETLIMKSSASSSRTPKESSLDVVMDDHSVDEPETFEEEISSLENNSKTDPANNGYNTQVTNTTSDNQRVTKVIKTKFFRLICTNPNKNFALSQQECLLASNNEEFDHNVQKIRKLSYEVMKLNATSLSAEKKIRRAASCVPVNIYIKLEHLPQDRPNVHVCQVLVDNIIVVSARGKTKNVFKSAIKVIRMRDIEIVEDGPGVGSVARGKGKLKKNVGRRLPGGLLSGEVSNHKMEDGNRGVVGEGVKQPLVVGSFRLQGEGKTSEEVVNLVKEEGKTSEEVVDLVKEEAKTSAEVVDLVKEEAKTSAEVVDLVKEETKTSAEVVDLVKEEAKTSECDVGSLKEKGKTCLLSSVQSKENSSKTVLSTTHIDQRPPVLSTTRIDQRPPVLSTTRIDGRPPVLSTTRIDGRPPVLSTTRIDGKPPVLSTTRIDQRPPVLSTTHIDQRPLVSSSAQSNKAQTATTEMDTGRFLAPPSVTNQRYRARKVKRSLSIEECLIAYQTEEDPTLKKIRKLACEALNQTIKGKNARNKLKAASKRVPVLLENKLEIVTGNTVTNFLHRVFIDGIEVASKLDSDKKKCRKWACEAAIQTIMMPKLEIVKSSKNIWQLKGSFLFPEDNFQHSEERVTLQDSPEECPEVPELLPTRAEFKQSALNGDQPILVEELENIDQDMPAYTGKFHCGSSKRTSQNARLPKQHTPPNPKINPIVLDSTQDWLKSLDKFVIVEKVGSAKEGAEKILRKSCIFNGVLLDYEFFPQGDSTRCVAKINDEVFADACCSSKSAATATASVQCLKTFKSFCWTLTTKQLVDSNSTVSREDVQNMPVKSDQIGSDNIGNKLLQKMGWSGGGIGKEGQGISEPISLMGSSNRQGLGFGKVPGKIDEFKKRLQEFVRNYCFSEKQEDLVFSREFNIDELRVVHNECWRMGLRGLYCGKSHKKCLCVSRRRTAEQLFEYVKGCGGETVKYKLVPPEAEESATCSEGLGGCSGSVE